MGRTMLFDAEQRIQRRHRDSRARNWDWVLLVNHNQVTDTYGQLDERLHYTYGAIYTSPGIGVMKAGPGSRLQFRRSRTRMGTVWTVASPTSCTSCGDAPGAVFSGP